MSVTTRKKGITNFVHKLVSDKISVKQRGSKEEVKEEGK